MSNQLRYVASGAVGLVLTVPLVAGALGWTVNTVGSGSMDVASGYAVGDLVVTAPLSSGDPLTVGDVVRVRGPRSSNNDALQKALEVVGRADPGYVHRVVELGPDGIVLTQGDANDAADAPHARSDLAGRVVAHAPKAAGTAWTWFRSAPPRSSWPCSPSCCGPPAVLAAPSGPRTQPRRSHPAHPGPNRHRTTLVTPWSAR